MDENFKKPLWYKNVTIHVDKITFTEMGIVWSSHGWEVNHFELRFHTKWQYVRACKRIKLLHRRGYFQELVIE